MAAQHHTLDARLRCALCGKRRTTPKGLIAFPLLAATARDAAIGLKSPTSDAFHSGCARVAYRRVMKTARH